MASGSALAKCLKFLRERFLCDGQGAVSRAILSGDRSCIFNQGFQWKKSGPGCSKLTTSLVNVSLKFQTLISEICHYFLLKKCEKLLQCKSFSHFFNKKYECFWL